MSARFNRGRGGPPHARTTEPRGKRGRTGAALLLLVAAVLVPGPADALGRPEPSASVDIKNARAGDRLAVEGRISVKGNEPFTFVALTTGDGAIVRLDGPKAEELRRRQNERLRVEGAVISAAAPALPLALRVDEVRPAKP